MGNVYLKPGWSDKLLLVWKKLVAGESFITQLNRYLVELVNNRVKVDRCQLAPQQFL